MTDAVHTPAEDSTRHVPFEELERGFEMLSVPKDAGALALIVARGDNGQRTTPPRVTLTPDDGVPGDAWVRRPSRKIDSQITVMRADVARLFANGQPLSLFGDNLLVDLDLSFANLPAGSRLKLGACLLEVTPEPHNGCAKFKRRFGDAALRLTADPRYRPLRLRGIYVKVIESGPVAVGDSIEVLSRG